MKNVDKYNESVVFCLSIVYILATYTYYETIEPFIL